MTLLLIIVIKNWHGGRAKLNFFRWFHTVWPFLLFWSEQHFDWFECNSQVHKHRDHGNPNRRRQSPLRNPELERQQPAKSHVNLFTHAVSVELEDGVVGVVNVSPVVQVQGRRRGATIVAVPVVVVRVGVNAFLVIVREVVVVVVEVAGHGGQWHFRHGRPRGLGRGRRRVAEMSG